MMADDMESDTCVGFKRRITEIEQQQPTSFTTHEDFKESFVFVSSPKEDQETSPKKVKSSFIESDTHIGDNQQLGFGEVVKESEICEVGFEKKEEVIASLKYETQRTVNDVKEKHIVKSEIQEFEKKSETERTVNDVKVEDIVNSEMGFSGIQEFEEKSVVEESTIEEPKDCALVFDEKEEFMGEGTEAESFFLEAKKKQLLEEIEVGSIFVNKLTAFASFSGKEQSGCQELVQNDAVRCSLKIEVIDDTALIESVRLPKTGNANNVKEAGVMGFAKGNKNEKQEVGGNKKAKRSRRKAKDAKLGLEMSQRHPNLTHFVEDHNGGRKNGDGTKIMYSREEMEALRFVNIVEQRKMWKGIYAGLARAVVKGYDDLAISKHQKQNRLNFDPWQQFGRKEEVPGVLSAVAARGRRNHLNIFVH